MTKHEKLYLYAACLLALAMLTGPTLAGAALVAGAVVMVVVGLKIEKQAMVAEPVRA